MAKPTELISVDSSPSTNLMLTFVDKVYTSRTLIIPKTNRTLAVTKARVSVSASDEQALSYLKTNADFEPLKE